MDNRPMADEFLMRFQVKWYRVYHENFPSTAWKFYGTQTWYVCRINLRKKFTDAEERTKRVGRLEVSYEKPL